MNTFNSNIISRTVIGLFASVSLMAGNAVYAKDAHTDIKAGAADLQKWLLPDTPPVPENNALTPERISLGQKLFFDPRLSGEGNMSCATCHNPMLGWSDGLPTAKGVKSQVLGRASPTIINTAFNSIQMWDGRKKSLEDQAMGPMEATVEMNMDTKKLFKWLQSNNEYSQLFEQAYPGEEIGASTVARALASYERTVISNNSAFDKWVKGDASAMTPKQVNGFKLFVGKAKCNNCHMAPNFTDNGFHNLGLASFGDKTPDLGRYMQKPIGLLKGAFKTPTLRDISRTAPYFHDGSAKTLMDVVNHYDQGGVVKTRLSPNMPRKLDLTQQEKEELVAFMEALTSPFIKVELPELPR